MSAPRVQQLHPSGATDGQVPVFRAGPGVYAPETPIGVTVCRSTFVAAGGESVLHLGAVPLASSEQVFVNGLLKVWGGIGYTLSGSDVTFTTLLSPGDRIVVSYLTYSACGVASLTVAVRGFTRPVALSRPVRRYHRIR